MKRLLLAAILLAAVLALPTQADFFQCVALVICTGSPNADIMNGSDGNDGIEGLFGNDVVFGNDGSDDILGDEDDDLLFGGNGPDLMDAGPGHDALLPGPDGLDLIQFSIGDEGNDTFFVFVGETVNCQQIIGGFDFDVLHLIGFGPYIAEYPYGLPEPIAFPTWIVIQDPAAGGYIFVPVGDDSFNLERIIGSPSPNVMAIDNTDIGTFQNQNCTGLG